MARYRLEEIAPICQGVVPESNQYWLLNLDAVESNTGRVLEYVYVDYAQIGASTITFDESNVLYSKLRPYLNKVVLPEKPGYATSEMLPLKPDSKVITREYLAYFLRSPSFVEYINGKTSGAKMPRANISDLKAVEIECPSINKQKEVVSAFAKLECIVRKRHEQLSALDDLIKARLVIYKRGFYSLRFSFMMKVDWLTKFSIGTPRPPTNVSASLHHPSSDSASWDESSLPFHGLICLDFEVLEPV